MQETIEHLKSIEVELVRKQEIISNDAVQFQGVISDVKKEIAKLMIEGDNNPLNKLKEDILTESLIGESKRRELS